MLRCGIVVWYRHDDQRSSKSAKKKNDNAKELSKLVVALGTNRTVWIRIVLIDRRDDGEDVDFFLQCINHKFYGFHVSVMIKASRRASSQNLQNRIAPPHEASVGN
jgi:hypothetical protein